MATWLPPELVERFIGVLRPALEQQRREAGVYVDVVDGVALTPDERITEEEATDAIETIGWILDLYPAVFSDENPLVEAFTRSHPDALRMRAAIEPGIGTRFAASGTRPRTTPSMMRSSTGCSSFWARRPRPRGRKPPGWDRRCTPPGPPAAASARSRVQCELRAPDRTSPLWVSSTSSSGCRRFRRRGSRHSLGGRSLGSGSGVAWPKSRCLGV
jgi:hypothetical protein